MPTLLILDGNNVAHRARHAFSLAGPDGLDVSVTFGFLNILRFSLKMFDPDACIIAWDGRIPKFRREKVPTYKANRKKDDTYDDFLRQLKELDHVLRFSGTVNVHRPAMEADDLVYHAAFLGQEKYDKIIIVSNDADLFQAVQMDNVWVYSSAKKKLIDREYVKEQFGIGIDQYVHWKALQGDTSDNVKGVPGIGPVRATKLFQQYDSLTEIVNAAYGSNPTGTVKGKMGENIREFGLENISKNVYVMSLHADRTGARLAVLEEVADFEPADPKKFKKFLLSKSFISIMDDHYFHSIRKLRPPELSTDARTPVICDQRFPVEE